MRTQQRDQGGVIRFGVGAIADAASGSGIAQGVLFTWSRTNTGEYSYNFDSRIVPLSVIGNAATSAGVIAGAAVMSAGFFRLNCVSNAGVATNINHGWECVALDKRT
jgi:hypothetical protein